MESSFYKWKNIHSKGDIIAFSHDREGILWLKVKSIIRKGILQHFLEENKIHLHSTTLQAQFEELFLFLQQDIEASHCLLNDFIAKENIKLFSSLDINKLISELYKLKSFHWGGSYNNSLDKYLVSQYVKAISSYDVLLSKFETEINMTVQSYVLNSWYNHWSSLLIEHLFKSHSIVQATVGQIKNVDFFINDIPFDLKVTYFPSKFMEQKRKEKGLPAELTYLKQKAKEMELCYDKKGKAEDIYYEITEKLKDKNCPSCDEILTTIQKQKMEILYESIHNPYTLMKWLYENQGEMRFGSENRLFLVLIDKSDFNKSWKLKRNIEILKPSIQDYLDKFGSKNIENLKVTFNYKEKEYHALADIIFIIK